MYIDLNEAIRIHARVGRARYGRGAKKRALKTAERLRQGGDHTGAMVWERLAAEISVASTDLRLDRLRHRGIPLPALAFQDHRL